MNRIWGEEYRTTIVCIDSWENDVPAGRFYNPYLPAGKSFVSLMQFLQEMEQVLDQMEFPKSFTAVREFSPVPPLPVEEAAAEGRVGRVATFAVRVLFRQNVSWQGSVTWLEGRQEQSFRSVLELLLLMNNAMACRKVS